MSKTQGIDLSEDRLLAIAADNLEAHNLIGALRMLNKNAEVNGNAEGSYMLYAETFDDMGLYENCVNGWFKYIDYVLECADSPDLSEAYEGLAVCYMNMGRDDMAAYYYNKLLIETAEELTEENREEIISNFLSSQKPLLKFAYPPKIADYSDEMDRGVNLMRGGDYDGAVSEFDKVEEGNECHSAARNYIAMCHIIGDKCDESEQECLSILQKYPDDVQALTTLAAVKNQQRKSDESLALAKKLLTLEAKSTDDIYKIATVCCENGLHAQAYDLFCRLEDELQYDCMVQFFKAVSAYNSGQKQNSIEAFDKILTINPDAVTAAYYRDYVRRHLDDEDYKGNPLTYFYRLPQEQRESNLKILSAFVRLGKRNARILSEKVDLTDCIRWCFDEGEGGSASELKLLGATCAVKAGNCDDLLRDVLLDASLSDSLKMQVVCAIAERNEDADYGVVVCNVYRKLIIPSLVVGRSKRKAFVRAYSLLISRFALINPDYVYLLNSAASRLYDRLDDEKLLGEAADCASLAAAVFKLSGIREAQLDDENICDFFGANRERYALLIGD
ncbi:MAG: tetratricopeptide repeat protein [Candidatus Coproplasma sp.]